MSCQRCSLVQVGFATGFDVIRRRDVIEHLPDPVALPAEPARVLEPGARLVLSTGDWGSACAQRHGTNGHLMTPPWHLTLFDRRSLRRAAHKAGPRVLGRGGIMRVTLTR